MPLTKDVQAEKVTQAADRTMIGSVGGGVLMTACGAVGLDALVRRRQPRTAAAIGPRGVERRRPGQPRHQRRTATRRVTEEPVPWLPQA
jgi:hypothetical protein